MLDIFNQDAFSVVSLTHRVNTLPFVPGQIGAAGYFTADGIDKTTVAIERLDSKLGLVAYTPRGGPGETIIHERANMRIIAVPHLQRDDTVNADEVQGRRFFGEDPDGDAQVGAFQRLLDRKVARHLRDFDATIEHQRVGALKGIVLDKNGATIINLYDAFGITAPTPIAWNFSNADANLQTFARTVIYTIEDALDAPGYTGLDVWCGRTFWATLQDHKWFRQIYLNTQLSNRLAGLPDPDSFDAFGFTFKRYKTGVQAKTANGGNNFIADDEARVVIRGVPDLFHSVFAPADYIETVNTEGLPRYLKVIPKRNDKGVDIECQTNPLSYCTRPDLLFRFTMS